MPGSETSAPVIRRNLPFGSSAGVFAVVFTFYVLGAILAWNAFGADVGPALFYPSAGVTVAAAMLLPLSRWPAIVAAIIVGESMVDLFVGHSPAVAAGYSLANVAEPMIGAYLVRRWYGGCPDLRNRRGLGIFVAGACVIGPACGGFLGGAVTHLADQSGVLENALRWWVGDGLGVLVVATTIMLWKFQSSIVREKPWETAAIVVFTAGASAAALFGGMPLSILILPFLAWAALRLDMLGASLAGGAVAFVVTIMVSRGYSAVGATGSAGLMWTQLYVAVVMTVGLLVAQEAAAHIRAVRDREAERRERVQLEGLSQLAQQLSAALTPEDIGHALENHVLDEAQAQGVALGLLSRDGEYLDWVAAPGYPQQVHEEFDPRSHLDAPLLGADVVRAGQPVLIRSKAEYEARYGASVRWLQMSDTHSMAGWPLTGGGKPFGALLVIWADEQPFDPVQVAYLGAVTTLVSQALVRARIYVDEHARAAVLQSALVPDDPGDTSGLQVCVAYEPADPVEGLGGDFHDVMSLPNDRLYLAVGDVVGHGLPAVEDMAQLRTAGRTLAHAGYAPATLMAELNDFTRDASQGKFATMAVAILDPTSGVLDYCSAGHPPSLLRRAATGEVLRLNGAAGPVLGPLTGIQYPQASVRVSPGDVLVMYTDGLVERRGVNIEEGIAMAEQLIAGWEADSDLATRCRALQEKLAPPPRRDDVCIIAVRIVPEVNNAARI